MQTVSGTEFINLIEVFFDKALASLQIEDKDIIEAIQITNMDIECGC